MGAVLTSLGAEGMRLNTPNIFCTARLSVPVAGNPTGAGDSVVAAIAVALAATPSHSERSRVLAASLERAVAWSAAAVLSPVAGEIDDEIAQQLLPGVQIVKKGM